MHETPVGKEIPCCIQAKTNDFDKDYDCDDTRENGVLIREVIIWYVRLPSTHVQVWYTIDAA